MADPASSSSCSSSSFTSSGGIPSVEQLSAEEIENGRVSADCLEAMFDWLGEDLLRVRQVCRSWNAVAMLGKFKRIIFRELMPDTYDFLQQFEADMRLSQAASAGSSQQPERPFTIDWHRQLAVERQTRQAMIACKDKPFTDICRAILPSRTLWTKNLPNGIVLGIDSIANIYRISVAEGFREIIRSSGEIDGIGLLTVYEHEGEKIGIGGGGSIYKIEVNASTYHQPLDVHERVIRSTPNNRNSGIAAILEGGQVVLLKSNGMVVQRFPSMGNPWDFAINWHEDNLYVGYHEGRMQVWDVVTGQQKQKLRYSNNTTGLQCRKTEIIGTYVFLHSPRTCLRVKKLSPSGIVEAKNLLKIFKVAQYAVRDERLLTIIDDGKVTCWNLKTAKRCWTVTEPGFPVCLNIVDQMVLIGKPYRSVAILSMRSGKKLFEHDPGVKSRLDEITRLLWHEGRFIVIGDRRLTLYSFRSSISARMPVSSLICSSLLSSMG